MNDDVPLLTLPDTVFVDSLFLFLDYESVVRLSSTCKTLTDLIRQHGSYVWRKLAELDAKSSIGCGYEGYRYKMDQQMDEEAAMDGDTVGDTHVGDTVSEDGNARNGAPTAPTDANVERWKDVDWKKVVRMTNTCLLTQGMEWEDEENDPEGDDVENAADPSGSSRSRNVTGESGEGGEPPSGATNPSNSSKRRRVNPTGIRSKDAAAEVKKIRLREEITSEKDLIGQVLFAGHAPHLHWLWGTRMVAFAGNKKERIVIIIV